MLTRRSSPGRAEVTCWRQQQQQQLQACSQSNTPSRGGVLGGSLVVVASQFGQHGVPADAGNSRCHQVWVSEKRCVCLKAHRDSIEAQQAALQIVPCMPEGRCRCVLWVDAQGGGLGR
jgi:hypothetical protein